MPFNLSKRIVYGTGTLAVVALCLIGLLVYKTYFSGGSTLDISIIKAIDYASTVKSYQQQVETQTVFPDRSLKIAGTYLVDSRNARFASYSTTSLFIKGDARPHTFTHQDIAIGDDVYVKVQTSDPVLMGTIQSNPEWSYFKNGSIPRDKANIAIDGPLQDNLVLLSKKGAYLMFVSKSNEPQTGSSSLLHYSFKLSKQALKVADGSLGAIVGRLGESGAIEVWIDPTSFKTVRLLFSNPPYYSTTTISNENTPLPIAAPIAKQS